MSISEQVKELREYADDISSVFEEDLNVLKGTFKEAADTIESLSAQLQAANVDRSADDRGTEQQYDKIMRINTYLLEQYGDKLWKEFGIEKTGDAAKDMFSMMFIFDEIYKREKEKYPMMWYEYCLCRNGKSE